MGRRRVPEYFAAPPFATDVYFLTVRFAAGMVKGRGFSNRAAVYRAFAGAANGNGSLQSTPSSSPGWWRRWPASRQTEDTSDPIQLVWMVKEMVLLPSSRGQSHSPSSQAGWGLCICLRGTFLARHLSRH